MAALFLLRMANGHPYRIEQGNMRSRKKIPPE